MARKPQFTTIRCAPLESSKERQPGADIARLLDRRHTAHISNHERGSGLHRS
jgi:hypothetical protein